MRTAKRNSAKETRFQSTSRFFNKIQILAALMVVFVQCLLPIAPAFASESDSENVIIDAPQIESTVDDNVVSEDLPIEEETLEAPATQEDHTDVSEHVELSETLPQISDEEVFVNEVLVTVEPHEGSIEDVGGTLNETVVTSDYSVSTTTEMIDEGQTATTTGDASATTEQPDDSEELIPETTDAPNTETAEEEPFLIEDASDSLEATTTEEITVQQPENHVVVNDQNRFSFSEQECARVGDGSFYCTTETSMPVETGIDRVFGAPDADGDEEIFVELDGELTQITFNQTDDSAPYYDKQSESLVWHRLINERYQIVSYSIKDGEEKILTADRYNNMQPSRAGDITVWQGWVGNDWEIMIDENGEQTMLTDNTTHDIGPRINGEYIIWQSFESDAWKAMIYNIRTQQIESIDTTAGASVENPRFVLVYDAKTENGDVETRGYDPLTGTSVPLSAGSVPTPLDIPDSDQTGEDRALITGTTQLKTKTDDESEPDVLPGELPLVDSPQDGDLGDLVIPPLDANGSMDDPTIATSTIYIEDVVIPPADTALSPVPDLVIPPYEAELDEPVLPQTSIATSS